MSTTVTIPQPPTGSTANFEYATDLMLTLHLGDDLNIMLQMLQNEFAEDQEESCKTGKLTDRQKTLVPLIAQVSSAFSMGNNLEDIKYVLCGIAKAVGADKQYWDI
jgi:hypothetical protein